MSELKQDEILNEEIEKRKVVVKVLKSFVKQTRSKKMRVWKILFLNLKRI